MKKLYDNELITKEVILDWYDKKIEDILTQHSLFDSENSDKLRKASEQFVEYVRKEDEDENEDEDNDGEEESEGEGDDEDKEGDSEGEEEEED